jgi:hypothetical protein
MNSLYHLSADADEETFPSEMSWMLKRTSSYHADDEMPLFDLNTLHRFGTG